MTKSSSSLSRFLGELRREVRPYWRIVVLSILFVAMLFLIAYLRREKKPSQPQTPTMERLEVDYLSTFNRPYNEVFADDNNAHLQAARMLHPDVFEEALTSEDKKVLSLVSDTPYYIVDRLTHSEPYLVPEAKNLLDAMAEDFTIALREKGYPAYRLIVTSLLRSQEKQRSLSRKNINAANESAHNYGTTLDISWCRYDKVNDSAPDISDGDLKRVLAAILVQYQKAGYCYIKHERKQACFHITARKVTSHR